MPKRKSSKPKAKQPPRPKRVPIAHPEPTAKEQAAAAKQRADLVQRLKDAKNRAKQKAHLGGRVMHAQASQQAVAGRAAKDFVDAYETGKLSGDQLQKLADMEAELESAGGDIEAFCLSKGMDPKFIPAVMKSTAALNSGASMKEGVETAVQEILSVAGNPPENGPA